MTADDTLGFAGIAPPTLRLYPIETHIAEKAHAYTLPRARPNSRLKDLPDLALLAGTKALDAKRVRAALDQTFGFRKTHDLPSTLPDPPGTWTAPYAAMAAEDQLAWPTLAEVTAAARAFLDPILTGAVASTWNPPTWSWERRARGVHDRRGASKPVRTPAGRRARTTKRRVNQRLANSWLLDDSPSVNDEAVRAWRPRLRRHL